MSTGERKWASSFTRRGGMTVLGKVAVPKPINLPSQKLENHGMDPNVEIVPKGTLSWGSRTGSPASNPWGASPFSSNTDNGRPSSGGSGTRPSTGGSEMYESTINAWGSNSRPSSASGALPSNQASGTTLRPHSADTRPGSSQLSRFAEPTTENSGAWAAAGSGDHAAHLKNEKFSLAAGDFPTLGSEKEDPQKNAHPSSQGDEAATNATNNSDNLNHGRRDDPPYEDGRRPNMERWHGDAPQWNPKMLGPPQHFAPWHGAPAGVWYRGPPGAPPYGPSGGPPFGPSNVLPYLIGSGGFPIERPYFHPPMLAPPIENSQPVPHHGAGPRGVHQNNGEIYMPPNTDGYFGQGMPMRPGFFPGPAPYDSYYSPPMGYCGPNERDITYLGPAGGAGVNDRHSTPNAPENVNSRSASSRHGSNEKPFGPEQGTSCHRHNPHEQYKVILKQQEKDHGWGDAAAANDSQFEKGYLHRPSSHDKDQSAGLNIGEKTDTRRKNYEGERIHGFHTHGHGGTHIHRRERVTDEANSTKGVCDVEKSAPDKALTSEVKVAPKDSGLIKKIKGLNAKTRETDGTQDMVLNSNRDEGKSRSHKMSNAPHFNNDSATHYKSLGAGILSAPSSQAFGASNSSRKFSNSGPQIRTDYRGKGKSGFLETEGWHKNANSAHFSTAASSLKSGPVGVKIQDNRSNIIAGKPESSFEEKDVVPDSGSVSHPTDIHAPQAKNRDIAKQRAMQLKREEERIKEQKAKAHAKLEELNRRTQLMESSTGKELATEKAELVIENFEVVTENVKTSSSGGKQGETHHEQLGGAAVVLKPNTIVIGTRILDPQLLIPKDDLHGIVTFSRQSPAERESGYHKIDARGEPQHNGGKNNALKSKNKGYKEKHNSHHEKVASEKILEAAADTFKYDNEDAKEISKNEAKLAESEVHHRINNDKSGKNKHRVEDASSSVVVRSVAPKISEAMKAPVDSGKPHSPNLVEATYDPSTERMASQLKEEGQSRINNHSRYPTSRKQSKNHQGHRAVDKTYGSDTVVWAPVRQHYIEVTEDSSLNVVSDEAESDHVQKNIKNKRAEIERYVPKPVAKELALQGSAQLPTSSGTNLMVTANSRVETAVENKYVDNNDNRQARAPGAWRQRVSTEASQRKGPKDNPLEDSIVSKDVHMPDSRETQEKKLSDGWNSPDDSNTKAYKAPDAPAPNFQDKESFDRGKRQYSKGTRNTGTYGHGNDHRKGQTGKEMDNGHSQLATSNSGEQDRTTHKEYCHEGGHPSSQWQSRPHDSTADNRRTRVGGVHHNSSRENNRYVKMEPVLHGDRFQSNDLKSTTTGLVSDRPHGPLQTDSGSIANLGPQHDRDGRERKAVTPHVVSYTSNQTPHAEAEQPPPIEHQHEQPHSSSGVRKNNNHNNRNVRGQESQGVRNSFEQDRRHHSQPLVRGRHRQVNSPHYEYKPKGQGQDHPVSANVGNLH